MRAALSYQKFSLTLKALEKLTLPPYKGSALRGGFGSILRRIACPLKLQECPECALRQKCVYCYVFETPPPEHTAVMRKYTTAPHPFVIEPPETEQTSFQEGETLRFGLVLVGKALEYLPYFVHAFAELGKLGIGRGRGKYELLQVSANGKSIYAQGVLRTVEPKTMELFPSRNPRLNKLKVRFRTPTRLLFNGRLVSEMEFHILLRQALRRMALLGYFHCGIDTKDWDFRGLIEEASRVRTAKSALRWVDWERYSSRQQARMKLGGVVGEVDYEGELSPFWGVLRAAEVFHVGKSATFGLGRIELQAPD
jgi:hypothetical protein